MLNKNSEKRRKAVHADPVGRRINQTRHVSKIQSAGFIAQELKDASVTLKKRKRPTRTNKLCSGQDLPEQPCIFSRLKRRTPMRIQDLKGPKCVFCDASAMQVALASAPKRKHITVALRAFQAFSSRDIFDAAVQRIPSPSRPLVLKALQRRSRGGRHIAATWAEEAASASRDQVHDRVRESRNAVAKDPIHH